MSSGYSGFNREEKTMLQLKGLSQGKIVLELKPEFVRRHMRPDGCLPYGANLNEYNDQQPSMDEPSSPAPSSGYQSDSDDSIAYDEFVDNRKREQIAVLSSMEYCPVCYNFVTMWSDAHQLHTPDVTAAGCWRFHAYCDEVGNITCPLSSKQGIDLLNSQD